MFLIPVINLIIWFVTVGLSGNYMDGNGIDPNNNRVLIYIFGSIVTIIINIIMFLQIIILSKGKDDLTISELKKSFFKIVILEVLSLSVFAFALCEYLGYGIFLTRN